MPDSHHQWDGPESTAASERGQGVRYRVTPALTAFPSRRVVRYTRPVDTLIQHLPAELVGFVLTLALSFLIGFEREERRPEVELEISFGGVRTFPIIGLGGFMLEMAFPDNALPFAAGVLVLGLLLAVSHWASIQRQDVGLTSEMAALLTFALGAAAAHGLYWLAVATGVVAVLLLQEKHRLEKLATRMPRHELATLVRFLLITGVILPVVPNQAFTPFELNPFKVWLVVVAVNGISYLSYLLQLRFDHGRGLLLAGLLGGAYSSTVTTVVLARKSRNGGQPPIRVAGAIIAATAMMYIRLWILVMLFAPPLAARLAPTFWILAGAGVVIGVLMSRTTNGGEVEPEADVEARAAGNPLEMSSAFTFAAIFTLVLVTTRWVSDQFGQTGLLVLAGIMGAADVDPFILGLAQSVGSTVDPALASLAVVITAASNNTLKGVYAAIFGDRRAGLTALAVLVALGLAGLPLYWLL